VTLSGSADPDHGRGAAFWNGVRQALALPALILGAGFLGFGSAAKQSGLPFLEAVLATATIWALPGQIAFVELFALGTPLLLVVLGVALANMRLLPMVVTLLPLLRRPGQPAWHAYVMAHFIAVTSWANAVRVLPGLPMAVRSAWFMGFAGSIWLATIVGTALGYHLAGVVPVSVGLALMFLNPIYFLLIMLDDLSQPTKAAALLCGGVAGPLFHLLSPAWALLLTGLVAGSLAFLITERRARDAANRIDPDSGVGP
jgi:predicted branched-subunit amino acid permease